MAELMTLNPSFDLNLGALLSPLLLLVVGIIVNSAKKAVMSHQDERQNEIETNIEKRHAETQEHLKRIETQTKETNGKVASHEEQLTILRTKTEVLMDIYLKGKAE